MSSQDVSDRHASPQGKHSAEDHGTASGEDEVVRAAVALIPGVDEGSINVVTARRDGTSQSPSSELPARVDPSSPSSVKDRAWTPSSKSSPSECPTCVRRNAGPRLRPSRIEGDRVSKWLDGYTSLVCAWSRPCFALTSGGWVSARTGRDAA